MIRTSGCYACRNRTATRKAPEIAAAEQIPVRVKPRLRGVFHEAGFFAAVAVAIPLAILTPIAVHLVFAKLLRVPLPAGFLPMPW